MAKKALLMILDGWGIGKHGKGDVIFNTPTPYLDLLIATSAHSQLQASGEDVGLPDGQMGNSEVGHLNIGAGRIVYQDLVKINRACKDGSIMENPQVKAAYTYAKENNKKLHLMGLTSDGGVHSSLDHLFKLIEIGCLSIAIWMVVTQTPRAVRALSSRFLRFVLITMQLLLLLLVVSMLWTAISVGSE